MSDQIIAHTYEETSRVFKLKTHSSYVMGLVLFCSSSIIFDVDVCILVFCITRNGLCLLVAY